MAKKERAMPEATETPRKMTPDSSKKERTEVVLGTIVSAFDPLLRKAAQWSAHYAHLHLAKDSILRSQIVEGLTGASKNLFESWGKKQPPLIAVVSEKLTDFFDDFQAALAVYEEVEGGKAGSGGRPESKTAAQTSGGVSDRGREMLWDKFWKRAADYLQDTTTSETIKDRCHNIVLALPAVLKLDEECKKLQDKEVKTIEDLRKAEQIKKDAARLKHLVQQTKRLNEYARRVNESAEKKERLPGALNDGSLDFRVKLPKLRLPKIELPPWLRRR